MLRSGDSKLSVLLETTEVVLDKEGKGNNRTVDWDAEG